MDNLNKKRVVIAGGTSGIGLATAKMLVDAGAEVIVTGRDEIKLQRITNELKLSPLSQTVDAADRQQLDHFFKALKEIDHLVITLSGGKGAGAFKDLDLLDLRSGFEGKFWPQLNCLQAALPFVKQQGSVTLVTAVSATSRKPGFSGLAAINGGIEAMVPVLAKELQPIRINAISPGLIDTSWWDSMPELVKQQLFEKFIKEIPVSRIGLPNEVAEAIIALIRLNYVTGRTLQVDGGFGL